MLECVNIDLGHTRAWQDLHTRLFFFPLFFFFLLPKGGRDFGRQKVRESRCRAESGSLEFQARSKCVWLLLCWQWISFRSIWLSFRSFTYRVVSTVNPHKENYDSCYESVLEVGARARTCVCVCGVGWGGVRERERDTHTHTNRQTDKLTDWPLLHKDKGLGTNACRAACPGSDLNYRLTVV